LSLKDKVTSSYSLRIDTPNKCLGICLGIYRMRTRFLQAHFAMGCPKAEGLSSAEKLTEYEGKIR